jgi:hypothetical protein
VSLVISPIREHELYHQIQQTGGYRLEHQEKTVFSIYFISKMNQHDRHDGCRYHKASRSRKSLEGPSHFLA